MTSVPYDLHMNSVADARVRNALYNVRSLTHTHTTFILNDLNSFHGFDFVLYFRLRLNKADSE